VEKRRYQAAALAAKRFGAAVEKDAERRRFIKELKQRWSAM
jgi:hypothetical protein